MIVVCDTSPLTNLAAIGQFDLLRRLYVELHIAQGVWDELNAGGKNWPGRDEGETLARGCTSALEGPPALRAAGVREET